MNNQGIKYVSRNTNDIKEHTRRPRVIRPQSRSGASHLHIHTCRSQTRHSARTYKARLGRKRRNDEAQAGS
ncbi:hypothetical protein BC835DRAFT_855413 [Cytidiella melzeri]|nr:hypothetical protein BC835DRAFT_855413 [Cytidiella melzeri]